MAKHTEHRCNNCPTDERTDTDRLPLGWWQITSHSHFGNTDHFHYCSTRCMREAVARLEHKDD